MIFDGPPAVRLARNPSTDLDRERIGVRGAVAMVLDGIDAGTDCLLRAAHRPMR